MDITSCAFVGYHPLRFGYDEEDSLCISIKQKMLLQILALYENGVTDFCTSCEVGASMWAAEMVL
ncbi:SLOG family protein [Desulfosporosinus metallidurans]|uniref:Uncharacterized protein n=1 Tax=Desulfosporosinus metallidurans TaxID=1888891 RepID=A0A1Q8QS28_9FIRM|nr:SLOG family protein [Desulfosporosinus metallidurans]OLN30112.1 hypothetical protein DSOL_3244 [Desulfosporosinus metallidurans]